LNRARGPASRRTVGLSDDRFRVDDEEDVQLPRSVQMTSSPPAGWYPDPSGATGQRWWDGQAWSATVAPEPQPSPTVPMYSSANAYQVPQSAAAGSNLYASNRFTFITIAIVAVYIVIAVETRFVIFGFLPLAMSLRSKRAREPLAPLAIGAACLSIVVAAALIFGH
jgi:hypothetical protein